MVLSVFYSVYLSAVLRTMRAPSVSFQTHAVRHHAGMVVCVAHARRAMTWSLHATVHWVSVGHYA